MDRSFSRFLRIHAFDRRTDRGTEAKKTDGHFASG